MKQNDEAIARIEYQVALLLRRAESAQATRPDVERLVRSAYLLLDELAARGPLGIAALADALQVDVSTVSRQIMPLERQGLLMRLPNPDDGRSSLVEITPAGQAQLKATRAERHALYGDVLEGWTEEDREALAQCLTRLNEAISDKRKRRQLKSATGRE